MEGNSTAQLPVGENVENITNMIDTADTLLVFNTCKLAQEKNWFKKLQMSPQFFSFVINPVV